MAADKPADSPPDTPPDTPADTPAGATAVSRRAARWATLAALPVALLAGLGAFAILGGFDGPGGGDRPGGATAATASPAPPQPTGPVTMAAPPLGERAQVVCRALLSQLPDALRDRPRRPVTAGPEQNAAYGEPPITVECGIPAATFPPTDQVFGLRQGSSRVCWHATPAPGGTVWTTVDREVPVRVTLPEAYEAPGQWVIEFSAPLVATVRSAPAKDIPYGCTG